MGTRNRHERPARFALTAFALVLAGTSFGASLVRAEEGCLATAGKAERELGIPNGLLQSLATVESGGVNPYYVSVGGRAVASRDEKTATKLLRDHRGRIRANTYVGCMQISLSAHRDEFQPMESIVDPRVNVMYAAKLLTRFHQEEGNWRVALVRYNGGADVQTASNYICKVWRKLNDMDQRSALLIENSSCGGDSEGVAPRNRRSPRESQVAAIN